MCRVARPSSGLSADRPVRRATTSNTPGRSVSAVFDSSRRRSAANDAISRRRDSVSVDANLSQDQNGIGLAAAARQISTAYTIRNADMQSPSNAEAPPGASSCRMAPPAMAFYLSTADWTGFFRMGLDRVRRTQSSSRHMPRSRPSRGHPGRGSGGDHSGGGVQKVTVWRFSVGSAFLRQSLNSVLHCSNAIASLINMYRSSIALYPQLSST